MEISLILEETGLKTGITFVTMVQKSKKVVSIVGKQVTGKCFCSVMLEIFGERMNSDLVLGSMNAHIKTKGP